MFETANNIYQNSNKSKRLNEIGRDIVTKFQNALSKFLPAISLVLLGVTALGICYAVASVNPTYLYQLAPALAIILMVFMLRFFSIPMKMKTKEESNK